MKSAAGIIQLTLLPAHVVHCAGFVGWIIAVIEVVGSSERLIVQ